MNHLKEESSPYLLQHKDNPVDWYPWCDQAFDRAEEEDKPILLSIGYSTCHWCHVMERESFTDPEVARIMNENFINIKVDREEYPDVDQFYMEAVQLMTRSGGWPLNCFLTPKGKPFYGGTYFPPESRHGRPSWSQLLQNIAEAFQNRRKDIEEQADKVVRLIEQGGKTDSSEEKIDFSTDQTDWIEDAVDDLLSQWDRTHGGFGTAPKFPSFPVLIFLFEFGCRQDREDCRELVLQTLEQICLGGIYDQVGGGLCRYSVDEEWNIPHFEKMIYDNAMLLRLLSRVYKFHPDPFWKRYLDKTVDFVLREWWDQAEGGFYSAFDADSEGEEGTYYVWTFEEWNDILSEENREILTEYYQISPSGNWEEGKNIPIPLKRPEDFAREKGIESDRWFDLMSRCEEQLQLKRSERTPPDLDHKKLLSWNAWMLSAIVESLEVLERKEERHKMHAELDRIRTMFRNEDDERFVHHCTSGEQGHTAYLDDYSALAELMLEAYQWSWNIQYIDEARHIMQEAKGCFEREEEVLLSYSSRPVFRSGPKLPDFYDQTTPSGNAQAALNFWNLGMLCNDQELSNRAEDMLFSIVDRLEKFPRAFSTWLQLASRSRGDYYEIVIIGPNYVEKANEIKRNYIPAALIMASESPNEKFPLLNRARNTEETMLYLCRRYSCRQPVTSIESFMKMLKEI